MKSLWVDENLKYDGSQLEPLKNYLKFKVLGDSVVSWRGACKVELDHMIDGEDLLADSKIESDDMLHFVIELFQYPLCAAVSLQRLMGEMMITHILEKGDSEKASQLVRKGDDLYLEDQKLNISIATCSANSSLIHFGVNVGNEGTPVKTCALGDFAISDIKEFSISYMNKLVLEVQSQKRAAQKVRSF